MLRLSLEHCTFTHATISFRRATRSLNDFPDRLHGNSSSSEVGRIDDSDEVFMFDILAVQALSGRARMADCTCTECKALEPAEGLCCDGGRLFDRTQICFQLYW